MKCRIKSWHGARECTGRTRDGVGVTPVVGLESAGAGMSIAPVEGSGITGTGFGISSVESIYRYRKGHQKIEKCLNIYIQPDRTRLCLSVKPNIKQIGSKLTELEPI